MTFPQDPRDYRRHPPGAPMAASEERGWATLSHVIPLAAMVLSAGLAGFVCSLVLYLIYRDRGPFVRQHAAASLNIQIMTGILLLVSGVLMVVLIGFVTYPLVLLMALVLHVLAALRAYRGEWYDPPMTPVFVR